MHNDDITVKCNNTTCDVTLDQSFWNTRWERLETGWDIGHASPAIISYMNQYPYKNAAILIPGCGNAYEAAVLLEKGFSNITLIDFAPKAVEKLKLKFSKYKQINILCEDYFTHTGKYNLIIEQTFFCAIAPQQREAYITKSASLLQEGGKLIGVLFDKIFEQPGPPFGGCTSEYKRLFDAYFHIKVMNRCINSIAARKQKEVFINLTKK